MATTPHISICPIPWHDDGNSVALPLKIADSLYFADVSEIISNTSFEPLSPLFYTESEVMALKRIRYGLVRHFECRNEERASEDERSASLLYSLYLGLKVIRPYAGRYQIFHYDMSQSIPRLPRGSRNHNATIICDYEVLNSVQWPDLKELAELGPPLIRNLQTAIPPISQAIDNLEIGYRADFLHVRHILWVVGLDALFTSREFENRGAKLSSKRIAHFLGSSFEIYPKRSTLSSDVLQLANPPLSKTLSDIYRLRNHFAHGTWPEKRWAGEVWRRSADNSRDIYYAEMLCESASSILRGCLRKILATPQLDELFNDKVKMNSHFATP